VTADNVDVVLDELDFVQSKRALGRVMRVAVDYEDKECEQVIDVLIVEILIEGTYVKASGEYK